MVTAEIAIGIEQDVEVPSLAIDKGAHFFGILSFVNADSYDSHTRFALPVFINF